MNEIELLKRKLNDVRLDLRYEQVYALNPTFQNMILASLPQLTEGRQSLFSKNTLRGDGRATDFEFNYKDSTVDLTDRVKNYDESVYEKYNSDVYSLKINTEKTDRALDMEVFGKNRLSIYVKGDIITYFLSSDGSMSFRAEYDFFGHRLRARGEIDELGIAENIAVDLLFLGEKGEEQVESWTVSSLEELKNLRREIYLREARASYANNPEASAALEESIEETIQKDSASR